MIQHALELAATGAGDAAISDATGIPRATVRNYRRRPPKRLELLRSGLPLCTSCGSFVHDFEELEATTYAYLLGAYLGDGCISDVRGKLQMQIVLDLRYPGVIAEVEAAMTAVRGRPPIRVQPANGSKCVHLASGWKSWACYFPQHGRGRKHERPIELVEWQRRHVDAAPEAFLRGLIHSDGCRVVNRFQTKLPSGRVATYEYPRYFFSNLSLDILGLFADTCDLLGIRCTRSNHRNLSVSHRDSVARMDEFIGPKT